jgi:hypothetical protein
MFICNDYSIKKWCCTSSAYLGMLAAYLIFYEQQENNILLR